MKTLTFFGPKYGTQVSLLSPNVVSKLSRFPLTSFARKPTKPVCVKTTDCDLVESQRTFNKFPRSDWGDHFLRLPFNVSDMDMLTIEMNALKSTIRKMLMYSQDVEETKERILIIYLLVALGMAYHFEDEIDDNLKHGFENIETTMAGENDLSTVSVMFWVSGHMDITCLPVRNMFRRFKGEDGKFEECHTKDVKGLLSLYEAAQLGTSTEDILDEAMSFSSSHLECLAGGTCPPHISRLIQNELYMPQHHNAEILFASEYISFYKQEDVHNKVLLEFAKLNFKFLQLHWIHELKILTKWWNDQDLLSKLPPYFRDRMVECHLYAVIYYFEPQYSFGRIMLAKLLVLLTVVDDTCDRYGSVPEVAKLLDCVERWDPELGESLPDYLKTVFKFTLDVFEDCERAGKSEEGLSFNVDGALAERTHLNFAEWAAAEKVPTVEEYLEVGGVAVTMYATIALGLLGLGPKAREHGYEWLKSRPKLVHDLATKGRLMNDMGGFKDDIGRGFLANVVNYYMKEYGTTEEETYKEFHKIVRDLEKSVNSEFLKINKGVPREILSRALNCGKMIDVTYRSGDGYTRPRGKFTEYVESLFVEHMDAPVMQYASSSTL
ncbi:Terpenoid cyclases/Protein prenyltransferases superfamily protein [Arabidopsis thaliana]|uniref:Terpenoid cyclases/Protein prenyltransferases superfamily protein n=1 Tax=Arabidopsis thaliana TaxID=3702 RepID=UPI0001E92C71|nr:Terpenoid cyclases/Protein prenyltransferases superfamily protein [Arabidopsis thaliana]AEC07431.1 Terpenoid cyclases/Protein prenyltransferases superfamily protein [Arabidopsis thaliana]|eukprot:NP_179904.3 Terpenoid cyclases/Protein prenyltransferases superfamily protein [Arabidopsis thaliana]